MFLEKMAALKREEVRERKNLFSWAEGQKKIADLPAPRDFLGALSRSGPMALIAEIKRASPSAGIIQEGADILGMAKKYEEGGASAISVLTEGRFFRGELGHIKGVKDGVALPVLQKDFVIDSFQIYEGRMAGADALLLIVALLERGPLREFAELTQDLGLVPLLEVHDEEDLEKIQGLSLPLIGINNRCLKTLEVKLETTARLFQKIPEKAMVISESGIKTREDVKHLQDVGVKGILVGETLMRAENPAAKIRDLLNLRD